MTGYLNVCGHSDAIEWLKQVPDASADSCVTDPPYGLGDQPDPAAVVTAWAAGREFIPTNSSGFAGETWDSFVPGPALWRQVFRVLKPGGYLLAFFGSRTYDWGTLAIRFAGFEVVDSLQFLHGRGFPKALDLSKAVDAHVATGGSKSTQIKKANDSVRQGPGRLRKSGQNNGIVSQERAAPRHIRDTPGTPEGARWKGWATALKPSCEPIVVARKPLGGSYAQSALQHGTGSLNVEASRIGEAAYTQEEWNRLGSTGGTSRLVMQKTEAMRQAYADGLIAVPNGRWPSNTLFQHELGCVETAGVWACHPDCAVRLLESQHEGASRFFYTAKTHVSDKLGWCRVCQVVFSLSEGAWGEHEPHRDQVQFHPTQKSLDLMEWLVRLVTQPGGVVADPCAGTFTTALAARRQGFNFIACDQDETYVKIGQARLASEGAAGGESGPTLSSYFCPGCKAKGEIRLVPRALVEQLARDNKKTTCPKCLGRYTAKELGAP